MQTTIQREATVTHGERTGPANRHIEWNEIRRHNRRSDCWVVIDGAVYDVTAFIDEHPGGEIICSLAGDDVSTLFHSSHWAGAAYAQLKKLRIGYLCETNAAPKHNDEFMRTLKRRVFGMFRERGIDYRTTRAAWAPLIATITGFAALWSGTYVLGIWPLAIVMGGFACALVGGFAHEYAHSTLFKNANKRNWSSYVCSLLWPCFFPLMSEKHFQYEHLQHHVAPLDQAHDYEVLALSRLLRLSKQVPHRWYFRYQQFYAPLVYAGYISLQVLGGFWTNYFRRRKLATDASYIYPVWFCHLVALTVHVALPIGLVGVKLWLVSFLLFNASWQFTTYLVAAVVHMCDPTEPTNTSWSYRVCHYTRNVLPTSGFFSWLSGGFNYQIEHHLLPSIAREHLPLVSPIVKEVCKEFDYPYHAYESFKQYLVDHYVYLAVHGEEPRPSASRTPAAATG